MLRAKARVKWDSDGDRNTKYFHALIKARRQVNHMSLVCDDGSVSSDRDIIGPAAAQFFSDQFNGYTPPPDPAVLHIIPKLVTDLENQRLTAIPDQDEVFNAIRTMNADSAPGPDGFTGHFYRFCWTIIKNDLTEAITCFFRGFQLPRSFSSTTLSLLPKVADATSLAQLRPISLCNFCHKIISHILMSRLAPILPKLISEEQAGFVPGRTMHDNIVLAHDLLYDLDRGKAGGNMLLKLDMAKAYDRLSWPYLIRVLRQMGFSEIWCDLIYRNISNCHYSVKWDGKVYGFFKSSRGVRQGDPLSPSLFIIGMEWFSRALNNAMDSGIIDPYHTHRRALRISHLLFADDVLIFANGAIRSVHGILDTINNFCSISGQKLNSSKSNIFFSSHTEGAHQQSILGLTGFNESKLPITYLGAPLYRGRTLIEHFGHLETRIRDRIHGWARHFLSMGARINLVNSVLNAIGIHSLLVLPIPSATLDHISSLIRNFIWDSGSAKRRHWLAWDSVCTPKESGGLGIRNIHAVKRALQGKRAWNFIEGKSMWARYARSRFTMGKRGSVTWNAMSHILEDSFRHVSWRFGDGATKVAEIFFKLGREPPYYLKHEAIRDIASNVGQLSSLISCVPERERDSFRNITFSDGADKIIWNLANDGVFQSKLLFKALQPNLPRLQWASHIWRPWIPPKVSVFLWKLCHNFVSTDDNVMRVGIPLASRCLCCKTPHVESSDHLFFESDWARDTWRYLGRLFDRPQIHSKAAMLRVWFYGDRKCYVHCLAAGMASIVIWELWKARNKSRFEGRAANLARIIRGWATRIASTIHSPYTPSMQADLTITAWGLPIPNGRPPRPRWCVWRPPDAGFVVNIAIMDSGNYSCGAFILRDSHGKFHGAFRAEVTSDPLEAVEYLIGMVFLQFPMEYRELTVCVSSHRCFFHLAGREEDTPHRSIYIRRRILQSHSFSFGRIDPVLNGAALALAGSMSNGRYTVWSSLSKPLQRALTSDGSFLPFLPRLESPPAATMDDIQISRHVGQRFTFVSAQDDISLF